VNGFTANSIHRGLSQLLGRVSSWSDTFSGRTRPQTDHNSAYSNGGEIYQDLNAYLTADTTYTLQVDVGGPIGPLFQPYRVQLLAAGPWVAQDNNTLSPSSGFLNVHRGFHGSPGDPHLAEQLQVRLVNDGSTQVNWDKRPVGCCANSGTVKCRSVHVRRTGVHRLLLQRRRGLRAEHRRQTFGGREQKFPAETELSWAIHQPVG